MVTALVLVVLFAGAAALVFLAVGTAHEEAGRPTLPDLARVARDAAEVPGTSALDLRVDGLAFPDWRTRAWQVVGGREDDLDEGRHAGTVAYRNGERSITYTIVSGPGVETLAADGRVQRLETGDEELLTLARVREGRTVVMTGAPASEELARTMQRLAVRGI